jgi:signal transduction histidine kinase
LIFALLAGWKAYTAAAALLAGSHAIPLAAFDRDVAIPYTAPLASVWLSVGGAASFQYFATRRRLRQAEQSRERYQQAIHFVAHEMRSPLSAIQGTSELMGRYQLPESKRAEMASMIHTESKRMGRLIQTFLDVERLTEGQMEMKREPFSPLDLVDTCLARAQPLAERKQIGLVREKIAAGRLLGDRELMEYALYNLINNAIKYSPAETTVRVSAHAERGRLRVAVHDEGIGMNEEEAANVFRRFYRTARAEASGEAGTGIGLSLVEQIVSRHGGTMEVRSRPGAGSSFTIVLPMEP